MNSFIRRYMPAVLAIAVSSLSMASTTCPTTSLNDLILLGGGGCTWTTGDGAVETFSNFTLVSNNGGLGTIPATGWTPTYADLGSSFRMTLTPSSIITETAPGGGQGSLYQFLLTYIVTETTPAGDGSGALTSETLGATVAGISGDGQTQVTKTLNDALGAPLGSPSVNFNTPGGVTKTSSASFAPQTSFTVGDSFNVNSGTTTGASATLSSFFNEVGVTTGVPEPATLGLIGSGLVGLGLISRRRRAPRT